MQSDLGAICRGARARIDVPAAPLAAIRYAATLRVGRNAGWITSLIASVSILAAAAGAAMLGTHIAFERDGKLLITANNIQVRFKNPTPADVGAAVRGANFPVTLPAGLPSGAKLKELWSSDGAIMLLYDLPGAWRASHHIAWIVLANPSAVATSDVSGKMRLAFASQGKPIHWRVGGEEVIIAMHNAMTPAELAHMKQAMLVR